MISTDTFTYESNKLGRLKTFNGVSLTYDSYMNPLTLNGATLTYERVNKLKTYTKNSITTQYKYDDEGIRYRKQIGEDTHYYLYDDKKRLVFEIITNGTTAKAFTYLYGLSDIIGFKYDNELYLYKKNIQGDVVAIYKKEGTSLTRVARYRYDAYGNHEVLTSGGAISTSPTFIGNINPFRYRSYYYDTETGFYYCQSRYYVPYLRRWLTMDDLSYLDNYNAYGLNLFRYCDNNPVMKKDETGHAVTLVVRILIGAVVGLITGALSGLYFENGMIKYSLKNGINGALAGLVFGAAGAYFGFIFRAFAASYFSSTIGSLLFALIGEVSSSFVLDSLEKYSTGEEYTTRDKLDTVTSVLLQNAFPRFQYAIEIIDCVLKKLIEYNQSKKRIEKYV